MKGINHCSCVTMINCISHLSTPLLYPSVCPGFTVDGSVQGSWDDTDPGKTVTIECQKKHVRDGSGERTCNSDGEWNKEAPLCVLELGQ